MGCFVCWSKTKRMELRVESRYCVKKEMSPANFVNINSSPLEDKYKVIRKIGGGATAEVNLVRKKSNKEKKAVKTISLENSINIQQVLYEIELMKELDHPNIVRVSQVFSEENNIHIVMEFCEGGELFDRIIARKSLTEKQAGLYFFDIASAVCYLHSKGIVHRDLKPENLLLENESDDSSVKIADFGASTFINPGEKLSLKFGTIYYIAPEVLDGFYDQKCDIWSIGVILYLMLSGIPPFNHDSDAKIKELIKFGKLKFPSEFWGRISKGPQKLIKKMLEKNPEKRPCIEEVLRDPWLNSISTSKLIDQPIAVDALRNLAKFNGANKLCRATLGYISAELLCKEELEGLEKLFEELDVNRDGKLSTEEIQNGFSKYSLEFNLDIEKLMEYCDTDGNGYIDYTEFITATFDWQERLSRESLREAFLAYDLDGNGSISLEEVMKVMGGEESEEEYRRLIQEVDTNEDGEIDMEEFVEFMS